VAKLASHDVEGYIGACVTQVAVVVDGRSADEHVDAVVSHRLENLLSTGQSVVDFDGHILLSL